MALNEEKKAVADHVLNAVRAKLAASEKDFFVGMFSNCREQGYAIRTWGEEGVCFAEERHSDQIVVYYGKLDHVTNHPFMWADQAKYFSPGQHQEAADWIVQYLEGL